MVNLENYKFRSVLFWSKCNVKQTEQSKRHKRVTYLGNNLDARLCGEFIAFRAISKVNTRLTFLQKIRNGHFCTCYATLSFNYTFIAFDWKEKRFAFADFIVLLLFLHGFSRILGYSEQKNILQTMEQLIQFNYL